MRRFLSLSLLIPFTVTAAAADTLVAARTIRSQTILTASDVVVVKNDLPAEFTRPEEIEGLEARVVLYQGRAISGADIGPAAIIDRNQIVTLVFQSGALAIATEARALGRGGIGDSIRVMNLASRNTVTGIIAPDGSVHVGGSSDVTSR